MLRAAMVGGLVAESKTKIGGVRSVNLMVALSRSLHPLIGIIIGASSLKHTIQNLDALKNGQPLPQDVLDAVDRCWEITRLSAAPYFRTKDQMMGTR